MTDDRRLVVGLVRGLHGLRGEVRVEALSDRAEERFAPGRVLFVEGSEQALTIASAAPDGPGWRLRFAELSDRTSVEALRDVYLEATVGPDEELPRGEYYWHEVIGAAVEGVDGRRLGRVVDVYRAGGAEVLLVRGPAGELDVPVVRSIVRIFAPKRGEIVVDTEALGLGEAREQPGAADEQPEAADEQPEAVESNVGEADGRGADG